jgi:hypothetical protein
MIYEHFQNYDLQQCCKDWTDYALDMFWELQIKWDVEVQGQEVGHLDLDIFRQ